MKTNTCGNVTLIAFITVIGGLVPASSSAQPGGVNLAGQYLSNRLNLYHTTTDVYTDADSAGNGFVCRGAIFSSGGENFIPAMNEVSTDNPHSGVTCIQAQFLANSDLSNWGGWYFLNGTLSGAELAPVANWGTVSGAGVDLTGAKSLSFYARGQNGGERVQFFCLGVGWQPTELLHRDSNAQVDTPFITLGKAWNKYTINLAGCNLSYVLGGFGWVATAADNPSGATFFLDDIQYNRTSLTEPSFSVSYETTTETNEFDIVNRNVGFTYDNAVSLIALLATGQDLEAKKIADAFVYAQTHDRYFFDGRIRNGYMGGEHVLPNGWTPNGYFGRVRTPGWYDTTHSTWYEDTYAMSSDTGNTAWVMLALLAMYEKDGGAQYLQSAVTLGEWVQKNCYDTHGPGGYTAGFWGDDQAASKALVMYKSTEHNIDLYAAFSRLAADTGNAKWTNDAAWARRFVLLMWDPVGGKFWTGTLSDGKTANTTNVPVDIQAWALLSLKLAGTTYTRSLAYVQANFAVDGGFSYSNLYRNGIWYEGTSQVATAYEYLGENTEAAPLIKVVEEGQDPTTGGVWATNIAELNTGFKQPDSLNYNYYYHRRHLGATAWLAIAQTGINPFWYGAK